MIFNDEKYRVYEYTESFSRVFLASSYKVVTEDSAIISTLFDSDFDSRNTLLLEEQPIEDPVPGTGSATIVSYKPTTVRIQTNTDAPKLLFFSDVYDPGWHATIDGVKTKLYRADYDFRAVSVPAGEHTVNFTYFPDKLKYGFILSGFALMALVAGFFIYENRYL